jgi:hypothetical protein
MSEGRQEKLTPGGPTPGGPGHEDDDDWTKLENIVKN